MRWKIAVSALALAGVAMIGAVFVLRGGVPGLKKDVPFIAAAQGPTKVAPPSDQTVTTSSDAGATLLHDNGKPGPVKVVNSEEQPVDLNAQASNNPPPANPPAPAGATDAAALAATINTPLVAPAPAGPPKGMTPNSPTRNRCARSRSGRTERRSPPPALLISRQATPLPRRPCSQASRPTRRARLRRALPRRRRQATRPASRSRRRRRSNCRRSFRRPSRPRAWRSARPIRPPPNRPPRRRRTKPTQNDAPAKPEKTTTAKKPKAGQVADATETTGSIAQPPVDATAATTSGGWSVQLAAPKSESEAQSTMTRLNSKYAGRPQRLRDWRA